MKIKKMLVPTDFSALSSEAVDDAISMAKQLGASVIFLYALEWPDHPDEMTPMSDEGYAFVQDRARAMLHDLVERAGKEGIDAEAELADGVPFIEIIEAARRNEADLIVMGTHGRSGFSRIMLGSQAERVVRTAPCPVLTVKSKKETLAGAA